MGKKNPLGLEIMIKNAKIQPHEKKKHCKRNAEKF